MHMPVCKILEEPSSGLKCMVQKINIIIKKKISQILLEFSVLSLKAVAKQIVLFDKETLIGPLGSLWLANLCWLGMKDPCNT